MATLLLKSAWAKFSDFRKEGHFFLAQIVQGCIEVQIRNQHPKIDPCANFQPNWTKDKGSQISTIYT